MSEQAGHSRLKANQRQCPTCDSLTWTGVQYQGTSEDYDGVSEFICDGCGTHFGRWTGRILIGGELERRYGRSN